MSRPLVRLLPLAMLLLHGAAQALEHPIGRPQTGGGLEVAAVYLQPIRMEPAGMMRPAAESDIHLEADIHALADNANGFPEGSWVPGLTVQYQLSRDGKPVADGDMHAMVASDGPHYGDNVKLAGPGKYLLTLKVLPPGTGGAHFGRHVDKETGVAAWFAPFTLKYPFIFAGTGKKGGY
ncbi:iron transporter [Chitinimonas koreensis]|uniref:iron transporter n=1 Tax=Chitinimonas koreensis TaxID=356302 RepID=UPI00041BDDC9|nr:iron transporter [Chitinimonas koreensis]QNM95137.1 iron transporter [Chitinimonas koreensis]